MVYSKCYPLKVVDFDTDKTHFSFFRIGLEEKKTKMDKTKKYINKWRWYTYKSTLSSSHAHLQIEIFHYQSINQWEKYTKI